MIKEHLDTASQFFGDLLISLGRAQVCLDKGIIEEPNLSVVNDAINDIDAIVTAHFGGHGDLLTGLRDKKQLLDDGIA